MLYTPPPPLPLPLPDPPPTEEEADSLHIFISSFQSSLYATAKAVFGTRSHSTAQQARRKFHNKPRRRLGRAIAGLGGMIRAMDLARTDRVRAFLLYEDARSRVKRNCTRRPPRIPSILALYNPTFVESTRSYARFLRRELSNQLNALIRDERTVGVVRGVLAMVGHVNRHRGHFYKQIHQPTPFHTCNYIHNARLGDEVVWDADRVMMAASRYGSGLFCEPRENDRDRERAFLSKIAPPRSGGPDWLRCPQGDFSPDEVSAALRAQSARKSPGDDAISGALLHHLPPPWLDSLCSFFSACLRVGRVPPVLRFGIIKTIPKKNDAPLGDLSYLRCITLLSCVYKVFERLISARILPFIAPRLDLNQRGFLPGRTTNQCIRYLDAVTTISRVTGSKLFVALCDERKAFDSVPPWLVLIGMKRIGLPDLYLKLVSNLLSPSQLSFISVFGLTPKFDRLRGVAQGGVNSPLYFVVAFDLLLARLRFERVGLSLLLASQLHAQPDPPQQPIVVPEAGGFVAFADDLLLAADSAADLCKMLEIVVEFGGWSGVEINPVKTIIAVNTASLEAEWRTALSVSGVLRDLDFKFVGPRGSFKYLGVMRSLGGDVFGSEHRRLEKFLKLSTVVTSVRWIPPSVAPRYVNELIQGTLQYSFQSTPPPASTHLTSFVSILNRVIRTVFRLAHSAHIPALATALRLLDLPALWRASVIFDTLVALHQSEWPLLQIATVNLLIAMTSPVSSSIVSAKSVGDDGRIRNAVDRVGWKALPDALRRANCQIVPVGIHPPPAPVRSRKRDSFSQPPTTRFNHLFRGYGVAYLFFPSRDTCIPVHAWLWRLDGDRACIIFQRGGDIGPFQCAVVHVKELVATGAGRPYFSLKKARPASPKFPPFFLSPSSPLFNLAAECLRWRRPGGFVSAQLFITSSSASHHTISLELVGNMVATDARRANFDGHVVFRVDKRGVSVSVVRALAAVLACAFACDGREVRTPEKEVVELVEKLEGLSARQALKNSGGIYFSALKQLRERSWLPSFVFDGDLAEGLGEFTIFDVVHDPLILLPIPLWVLFDGAGVVIPGRFRATLYSALRKRVDPATAIGRVISTYNPDFAPLRKIFFDPSLHSQQSLLHFISRAISGSLPTHHRILKPYPFAAADLICPDLDLSCKLCNTNSPDKQLHVLGVCPALADLRRQADATIAPLFHYTPCPAPLQGACVCGLGDLLRDVSVVSELHDVEPDAVAGVLRALHSFARASNFVVIYSDGSLTRPSLVGGAGGLVVVHSGGVVDVVNTVAFWSPVLNCTSSSHAELFAIVLALTHVDRALAGPITVYLFCDSAVAIGWASGDSVPDDPINRALLATFAELCASRQISVVFFKVKGHAGVVGNELADRYAKRGARAVDGYVGPLLATLSYADAGADWSAMVRPHLNLHESPPLVSDLDSGALMLFLSGAWLNLGRPKGKISKDEIVLAAAKVGFDLWKFRCREVKTWERARRLRGKWWKRVKELHDSRPAGMAARRLREARTGEAEAAEAPAPALVRADPAGVAVVAEAVAGGELEDYLDGSDDGSSTSSSSTSSSYSSSSSLS